MNLCPPSVTVSTHTSASNAAAFQFHTMPNTQMLLCTQSIHSFSFLPRPLCTAPSRFPNTIRFVWRSPCPQKKSSRAQRCLNALTPGYLEGTVVRGHPVIWSLALCPDDAEQDPVVYGAELFAPPADTCSQLTAVCPLLIYFLPGLFFPSILYHLLPLIPFIYIMESTFSFRMMFFFFSCNYGLDFDLII